MRQYAFTPRQSDPRIEAEAHWEDLREELNVTRDQLEASEARERSQAALIDMLRNELAETKLNCAIIERSNTVMRTKLQAAGMLVLDALKADELDRGVAVSEYAPMKTPKIQAEPKDEPQDQLALDATKPIFLRTAMPANQFSER